MANESLIFDILARDGASPSLKKVGDAALEASGSLKDLSGKLKDINGRTAAARVKLDGDKEAQAELDKLDVKLIRLGKAVANPDVKLDGVARARADISGIDLALDRLNAKSATPDVSGGGGLGGLFGGGGGAAGGAASGGGGLLSSPAGIGAAAGGGLLAAGLVPGAVGLGIGGGVGLGGIGLVSLIATQAAATIKLDQAQVKAAKSAPQLAAANRQLAADMKANSPFIAITADIKQLLVPLQQILTPFAKALDPIIKSFGSGLAKLGPQMTAMFQASLPFVKVFANLMLTMGKTLFPVLTQAMNQMVKSGALKEMTQGMVYLIQGLAGFVVALGPGMKASGQIFERICLVLKGAMIGVGIVVSAVANILEINWPAAVNRMRRDVVSSFDALRHDVSSIWDTMWNNTLGRLQRGIADDQRLTDQFRHGVANTFDAIRHNVAANWDDMMARMAALTRSGLSQISSYFARLPGQLLRDLFGLGHSLYAVGHSVLTEFWDGLKSVASGIGSWFSGFGKMIINVVKKVLGVFSPSTVFYDIGKNLMLGLKHGVIDHAHQAVNAARQAAFSTGQFRGSFGPGVAQWRPDVIKVLAMLGLPSTLAGNVLYQMQTESGGNPNAINLTDSNAAAGDPSRGLMQTIGTTFAAYRSWSLPDNIYNPMANIFAAVNYAMHRYGRTLMSGGMGIGSGHGYDQGGWLMPGITMAVNRTGRPERVLAPGQSGGVTPVVLQVRTAHGATNLDRALVEIIQKYVTVNGGDVQASLGRT